MTDPLRRVHELIGQLTSKVSEIDQYWYLILTCLMPQSPREIVDAIVNVHKTGEGQRQPVIAVAATVFPKDSVPLRFVGQLKKRTDDLSGRRNAAVHSIISIQGVPGQRVHARGYSKPSKLAGKDVEAELLDCLTEADRIIVAADSFLKALSSYGETAPDLDRPRLKDGWKSLL